MSQFTYLLDRIRRIASRSFAAVVPNSDQFKKKVRCLLSLYKLYETGKSDERRLIIYYTSGSPDCPGLADRLKAMVTGYIVAAENNYRFFIYHDLGFRLEDYLLPNTINWKINRNDISLGLNNIRFLWFTQCRQWLNPRHKEYHMHYALDATESLPEELQEKYQFSRVFHQLFTPAPRLARLISDTQKSLNITENKYIAIHIRFLDFFETVESTRDTAFTRHADENEQKEMLGSIHRTIEMIRSKNENLPIVLFSDSNKFLSAPHADYIRLIPGRVGHIYANAGVEEITDRAFLDMFIIAGARRVFNIIGPGTYTSGYSYIGARIGQKPFTRVPRIEG